jgi:hypothetical protein
MGLVRTVVFDDMCGNQIQIAESSYEPRQPSALLGCTRGVRVPTSIATVPRMSICDRSYAS